MEAAENAVDYYLTGGTVSPNDPAFWLAAGLSMIAGLLSLFHTTTFDFTGTERLVTDCGAWLVAGGSRRSVHVSSFPVQ